LKKLNIIDFNGTDKGPEEVEGHKSGDLKLEPKEYK